MKAERPLGTDLLYDDVYATMSSGDVNRETESLSLRLPPLPCRSFWALRQEKSGEV